MISDQNGGRPIGVEELIVGDRLHVDGLVIEITNVFLHSDGDSIVVVGKRLDEAEKPWVVVDLRGCGLEEVTYN